MLRPRGVTLTGEAEMKVLAKIVFSWEDDDPDSAVEELRRAGYTVHRMSSELGLDSYENVEAIIDGSADDKIMDAIWDEVQSIVDRNGGLCDRILTVDEKDYVPFEWFEHQWKINFAFGH
jgi:hypothetical protein